MWNVWRHTETGEKIGDFKNSGYWYVYEPTGLTATAAKKILTQDFILWLSD